MAYKQEGTRQAQSIYGLDENKALERAEANILSATSFINKLRDRAEKNKNQYNGEILRADDYLDTDEPQRINLTYRAIETIVPIVTRKSPDVNVFVFPRKYSNRNKKIKLENYLRDLWNIEINMRTHMETLVRQLLFSGVGVLKVFYNTEEERVDSKVIPLKRVIFPKTECYKDIYFVAELIDISFGEADSQEKQLKATTCRNRKQCK